MNTSWWKTQEELDDDQKAFILLPPHGKHSLEGPPGSGKTNLLLLRAQYMAGKGEQNVLVVTYTKTLTDFIRNGIGASGLINPNQVRTYHSWAAEHIFHHLGHKAMAQDVDFDEAARAEMLAQVIEANKKISSPKLYSAIFVDEAQDFNSGELEALLCLSDNVCICGDERQGIYQRDGLSIADQLGLQKHQLKRHFRIGQRIARVADRLMPPFVGQESLESTANYNPKTQGIATAKMNPSGSRDQQFAEMLEKIRIQLDAFKGDTIGVFCATKDTRKELRERFNGTDISGQVCVHGIDQVLGFASGCPIHVLTMHSAKGTEFRAVHLFGAEEMAQFPFKRTRLAFTAVTRAKTALNAYRTGPTSVALENAFAEPANFGLDDLLPGKA
jgi:superfamily I DNA/RNA helicase